MRRGRVAQIPSLRRQRVQKGATAGVHMLVDADGKTHNLWLQDCFTHPGTPPEYFIDLVGQTAGRPVMDVA